jgi:hypothetical protein
MSFDDYWFTRPSFIGGVGRVIDIGGVLGREAVKIVATPAEADARALSSDFRVVAKDLKAATNVVAPDVQAK